MPKDTHVGDATVLGGLEELNNWVNPIDIVLALGDSRMRREIFYKVQNQQVSFPSIVHPTACLGDLQNAEGLYVAPHCTLTDNLSIGKQVVINLNCTVGHDVVLGDFCSIMPGVNISGGVELASGAYIGTGVTILPEIRIGENAVVGAGAVVTKEVLPNTTVYGVPARLPDDQ